MAKQTLSIILASLPDYQSLVAELYFEGRFVALVSEERGNGMFEVELPSGEFDEVMLARRVDLDAFLAALQQARDRLAND